MLSYCNYIRGKNGPTLLVLAGLELEVGIRDGSTFAILPSPHLICTKIRRMAQRKTASISAYLSRLSLASLATSVSVE